MITMLNEQSSSCNITFSLNCVDYEKSLWLLESKIMIMRFKKATMVIFFVEEWEIL